MNVACLTGVVGDRIPPRQINGGKTGGVSFTVVAVSKRGEKTFRNFVPVVVWGGSVTDFKPGTSVSIKGEIQTGSFQKQDGTKKFTVEVHCFRDDADILGGVVTAPSGDPADPLFQPPPPDDDIPF